MQGNSCQKHQHNLLSSEFRSPAQSSSHVSSPIAVPQSVHGLFDAVQRVDQRVRFPEGKQQSVDVLRLGRELRRAVAVRQDSLLSIHRAADKQCSVFHRCWTSLRTLTSITKTEMQFVVAGQDDVPHGKDDSRRVAIALDHPLRDFHRCDALAVARCARSVPCGHGRPAGLQVRRLARCDAESQAPA